MNLFHKTVELEGKFVRHPNACAVGNEGDWDLLCLNGDSFKVMNAKTVPDDTWDFFEVKATVIAEEDGEQLIKIVKVQECNFEELEEEEIDFGMAH